MKKFVIFVICLCVISVNLPFISLAADAKDGNETKYESDGTFIYEKNGSGITVLGFDEDVTDKSEVVIPANMGRYLVTEIGAYAFEGEKIKAITIPATVKAIGDGAFKSSRIESIEIPDGVTVINQELCADCSKLKEITLPDNIERIDAYAFSKTKYINTYKNWKNGALYIGRYLISVKASVKGKFTVADDTRTIAAQAFRNCEKITEITIPDGIKQLTGSLFFGCEKLEKVSIPESVEYMDADNFYGTEIYNNADNWENGVLYIGSHLICADKFAVPEEYVVRDGTKTISNRAFENCEALISITLPKSVVYIGSEAFFNCTELVDVALSDGIKKIGNKAFCECSSIKSIALPNSVKNIGTEVFSGCTSLENIEFSSEMSEIPSKTFCYCEALTTVSIPENIKTIRSFSFAFCNNLKKIYVTSSLQTVEAHSFMVGQDAKVYCKGSPSDWNVEVAGSGHLFKKDRVSFIASTDSDHKSSHTAITVIYIIVIALAILAVVFKYFVPNDFKKKIYNKIRSFKIKSAK